MFGVALAVSGAAWAQQLITLEQGPTELQPCLDDAACRGVLEPLATETLVEFGWFLQHDSMAGSALTGRGNGLVFSIQGESPELGRKNLIVNEVELPPLLPKLEVGYQVGSYTYDDPFPQVAVSAFVFPPIRIDGFTLLNTGLTVSAAMPVVEHYVWLGAEVAGTYGRVRGEMLGDGDVLDDVDSVSNFVDIEPPACADTAAGCIDQIQQMMLTGRVGVAIEPIPELFFYSKLAIGTFRSDLDIAYDTSKWRVKGVQPAFSYGLGVRIEDRVTLGAGGVTGPKPERFSTDDARLVHRVNVSLSVRTGDRRYWYESESTEPPSGVTSAP